MTAPLEDLNALKQEVEELKKLLAEQRAQPPPQQQTQREEDDSEAYRFFLYNSKSICWIYLKIYEQIMYVVNYISTKFYRLYAHFSELTF